MCKPDLKSILEAFDFISLIQIDKHVELRQYDKEALQDTSVMRGHHRVRVRLWDERLIGHCTSLSPAAMTQQFSICLILSYLHSHPLLRPSVPCLPCFLPSPLLRPWEWITWITDSRGSRYKIEGQLLETCEDLSKTRTQLTVAELEGELRPDEESLLGCTHGRGKRKGFVTRQVYNQWAWEVPLQGLHFFGSVDEE